MLLLLLPTRSRITYTKKIEIKLIPTYNSIKLNLVEVKYYYGDTRWRSWLRHCASSQKVACSIPDGVNGIFHSHNSSGRTLALELTQPLTEMSTRNISWG
jgi:hypothetical protein